ncbi:MAG: hypothetical protein IT380_23955 [Myxococcales bacterium]|nr:hypothetical protein [Myxococcales bacterium]
MSDRPLKLPARFRLALLGKGALLAGLGAGFGWLGVEAWAKWHWHLLARLSGVALCAVAGGFLLWAAGLALLDVLRGEALVSTGAVALKSRRAGYSLKLPSGRFVEYILHNPWQRLTPGKTYTVTYGRHSGVLVAPPREEPAS